MYKRTNEKHTQPLPSARKIRRACNRELYRTIKKLNKHILPDQVAPAEEIYYKKVILNLPWIVEHGNDRKQLADWWAKNVCPEIATLWDVEPAHLAEAFRDSFV